MSTATVMSRSLVNDGNYAVLKAHVLSRTGLAYYADKDDELAYRLSRRMETVGQVHAGAYLELLRDAQTGEHELDLLIEHLTIGETHFFRHSEVFEALESCILPSFRVAINGAALRIWSAACSVGAEPYSISILLKQLRDRGASCRNASIVGTDISRLALEQAARAEYSEWNLRGMPDDVRAVCFQRRGTSWVLSPAYREGVTFQYHNLVQHPFPSLLQGLCAFDIVFCRNVLMYFDAATMRRVIGQFYEALIPGGWLIVGHAEVNVELFRAFETVNVPGAVLYRRPAGVKTAVVRRGPHAVEPVDLTATVSPQPEHPKTVEQPGSAAAQRSPAARTPSIVAMPGIRDDLESVQRLANTGQFGAAESVCRKLLEEHPLEASVYLHLALVLAHGHRDAEAIELIRKALYLDRSLVAGHLHLGLLYQRSGNRHGAKRSLETALALIPSGSDAAIPCSDEMTAAELRELILLQLEVS